MPTTLPERVKEDDIPFAVLIFSFAVSPFAVLLVLTMLSLCQSCRATAETTLNYPHSVPVFSRTGKPWGCKAHVDAMKGAGCGEPLDEEIFASE